MVKVMVLPDTVGVMPADAGLTCAEVIEPEFLVTLTSTFFEKSESK
jgi:hypothetical protein